MIRINYKITVVIITLLISAIGFAQNADDAKKKKYYRKNKNIIAHQQIKELHEGVLLVRLRTKKKSIAALRERGANDLANKIENQQAEINKEIINVFKSYFSFCPTYFFYSEYSKYIKEKQFDKVEFLNKELQYDPAITLNSNNVFTAEFGIVKADTAKYFDGYYYESGDNGIEKRTKYHGNGEMGFGALIIKSDQFVQLRRPFPFYVRTYRSLPIKRKPYVVVGEMNRRLHEFYESNQ